MSTTPTEDSMRWGPPPLSLRRVLEEHGLLNDVDEDAAEALCANLLRAAFDDERDRIARDIEALRPPVDADLDLVEDAAIRGVLGRVLALVRGEGAA